MTVFHRRVVLTDQPANDTGGVRRQMSSSNLLKTNMSSFFEGPRCSLRPRYTAESHSSGLFKTFGHMIAHAIAQDGVGFPACPNHAFGM